MRDSSRVEDDRMVRVEAAVEAGEAMAPAAVVVSSHVEAEAVLGGLLVPAVRAGVGGAMAAAVAVVAV